MLDVNRIFVVLCSKVKAMNLSWILKEVIGSTSTHNGTPNDSVYTATKKRRRKLSEVRLIKLTMEIQPVVKLCLYTIHVY